MFNNPTTRMLGRALVAALATAAITLRDNTTHDRAAYQAALVAATLVFCELFTPLNSLLGFFKGTTP